MFKSHPDWKLEVHFKENYEEREKVFREVQRQVEASSHVVAMSRSGNFEPKVGMRAEDIASQLRNRFSQNSVGHFFRDSWQMPICNT